MQIDDPCSCEALIGLDLESIDCQETDSTASRGDCEDRTHDLTSALIQRSICHIVLDDLIDCDSKKEGQALSVPSQRLCGQLDSDGTVAHIFSSKEAIVCTVIADHSQSPVTAHQTGLEVSASD
jgi:hypothetical protein